MIQGQACDLLMMCIGVTLGVRAVCARGALAVPQQRQKLRLNGYTVLSPGNRAWAQEGLPVILMEVKRWPACEIARVTPATCTKS